MESAPARRPLAPLLFPSALTIVLTGAAVGLTLLLQRFVSTAGYIFFYAAVLGSAWFGGKWFGWLAVILSGLIVAYITPPSYSFAINRESLPLFIEFAASAAIVGWFSSWRKRAEKELRSAREDLQIRVEERTKELRHANKQLHSEIADRRRAEEAYHQVRVELARLNRISAMGALAASISHEINQPLAAVVANADAGSIWLAADPPNLEEARSAIASIAREGTRASEVVRRIRAMFARGAPEIGPVQINDLIREVAALLESEISRNRVAVKTDLQADLLDARGDRVQLRQVLLNLITNAVEAMSGVNDRPRMLQIRSGMRDGCVLVSVQDAGVGIDPVDYPHIFDAFFTTKSKGMGMGLSISQSIIEAHGGRLWASSAPDRGTVLEFTLPADQMNAL
jgi:C4-dicarboxylate-specific signal transduction histidine kinase